MADITRTMGDTRRITVRILDGSGPVPLTGWTNFKMLVSSEDDGDELLSIDGVVIDELEGRVAFTQSASLDAGSYFYNCKAVDNNGEVGTFKKGRYLVVKGIG